MLKKSLFSVIIPVYNREEVIKQTLDSIVQQSYGPIEIVLVDDGSNDNTAKTITDWRDEIEPDQFLIFKYIYQENKGVSAARNVGYKESEGKYIQFLDSDDLIHPDRLSKLVDTFETKNADLLITGHEVFDHFTNEVLRIVKINSNVNPLELVLEGKLVVHPLICAFTSSLARQVGNWNESIAMSEDTLFINRALCLSNKSIYLSEVLASKRKNLQDQRSLNYSQECRLICQEQLANDCSHMDNISLKSKRHHRNALIRLCLKYNSKGQYDLAKKCYYIVSNYGIEETPIDKLKLWICRTGRIGGLGFAFWVSVLRILNPKKL
jgi:glycosyltransferase involved in cell wall biosynthesis